MCEMEIIVCIIDRSRSLGMVVEKVELSEDMAEAMNEQILMKRNKKDRYCSGLCPP